MSTDKSVIESDPLRKQSLQPARTIAEVIATMRGIDATLPPTDGLKWFNLLYLTVTELVQEELGIQKWSDISVLARLDVAFANLYFSALAIWITDAERTPPAWRPLLQARQDHRQLRIQFAFAGMNAHINRDLCVALFELALSQRAFPKRGGGVYQDYCRVNEILERAEARAVQFLATGIIGQIDQKLGDADDILAMWGVRSAREAAWINAEVLWHLRSLTVLKNQYIGRLDRTIGFASRGLLQPVAAKFR